MNRTAAFIAVYAASLAAGAALSSSGLLAHLDHMSTDGPPWFFIRRDLLEGAACWVGLAGTLGMAAAFRRSGERESLRVVWMALLFYAPFIIDPLRILWVTRGLFTGHATSTWTTFDDYLYDPVRLVGIGLQWVLAGGVAAYWRLRYPPEAAASASTSATNHQPFDSG